MKKFAAALGMILLTMTLFGAEYDPKETIGASAFVQKCEEPVKKRREELSAYLIGPYYDLPTTLGKLVNAGFTVIAQYPSGTDGITLVITNKVMREQANTPGRGFAAILRLYIDYKRQQISITNPNYFFKAFLQDDFSQVKADAVETALRCEFADLTDSKDELSAKALPQFQFMMGMPKYNDMIKLGSGETSKLLKQARSYDKKALVFELELDKGRYLLGYELSSKTKSFIHKIGSQNGAILPYTILIEDGTAKALDAKYYIALSYPLLDLSAFATILSTPRAIKKELQKPFK